MLQITIARTDLWDERKQEFVPIKEQNLQLEHSLVSISKWESKWHKSFLSTPDKTTEEVLDYVRCMTITQNVDPNSYLAIVPGDMQRIKEYINDPSTATTFRETPNKKTPKKDIITAEIIYHWMIELNIPVEFQKWHLNKLMTLIEVCKRKNSPEKKMSAKELAAQHRAINEARRKQLNSKG